MGGTVIEKSLQGSFHLLERGSVKIVFDLKQQKRHSMSLNE